MANLEIFFKLSRHRFYQSVGVMVLISLFWPLLPLLSVAHLLGLSKEKDRKGAAAFYMALFFLAFAIMGLPLVLLAVDGGTTSMFTYAAIELIGKAQLTWADIVTLYVNLVVFLILCSYAWAAHGVEGEVDLCKHRIVRRWMEKQKADELGMKFFLSDQRQKEQLPQTIIQARKLSSLEDEEGLALTIPDLMALLQEMPGWGSVSMEEVPETSGPASSSATYKSWLSDKKGHAKKKGILGIDRAVVNHNGRNETMTLSKAIHRMEFFGIFMKEMLAEEKLAAVIIILLVCLRAAIPRIYLVFGLGGPWLPESKLVCFVVIWSTLCSVPVVATCFMIFWSERVSYKRNIGQTMLLSSLIDVKKREEYVAAFIDHKHTDMLKSLPLLDLRWPTNVLGWAELRRFVTLDQMNEKVMMSMLMEMAFLATMINLLIVVVSILTHEIKFVTALVIVIFFDLTLIGCGVLEIMYVAICIDSCRDEQLQGLADIQYDVAEQIVKGIEDEDSHLETTKELIGQLVEKIEKVDEKQRLIFGMDMDPTSIFMFGLSLLIGLFSTIEQFIALGLMPNIFDPRTFYRTGDKVAERAQDGAEAVTHAGFLSSHVDHAIRPLALLVESLVSATANHTHYFAVSGSF